MVNKKLIVVPAMLLAISCAHQGAIDEPPSSEFKFPVVVEKAADPFTGVEICRLVYRADLYYFGRFSEISNRTEIIAYANQASQEWLGVYQEHVYRAVPGGGHFLAGSKNGKYFGAKVAIENGITEPFSMNYENKFPTAVVSTVDVLSWITSGATEVTFRRSYDGIKSKIPIEKVDEFVSNCLQL